MRYREPIAPLVPPFAIVDGFGPICVCDSTGRAVYDDCTPEEAAAKLIELAHEVTVGESQ